MPLLPDAQIYDIHAAAIRAGLDRDTLLNGIERTFVATLPGASNMAANMLSDLHQFNQVERLANGTIPLLVWLENAHALASARVEGRLFRSTLLALSAPKSASARLPTSAFEAQRTPPEPGPRLYGPREHFLVRMSYAIAGMFAYVLTTQLYGQVEYIVPALVVSSVVSFGTHFLLWITDMATAIVASARQAEGRDKASLRVSRGNYLAEILSTVTFGVLSPTLWFHFKWEPGTAGWTAALIATGVNLGIRFKTWISKTEQETE